MECSLSSVDISMIGQTTLKSRVPFSVVALFLCYFTNMYTLMLSLEQQVVLEPWLNMSKRLG